MSDHRRLSRAEVDALWRSGAIRPWGWNADPDAPRPIHTPRRRFVDVGMGKARAARLAEALRARGGA